MAALPLMGVGFGHWEYALDLRQPSAGVLVVGAWVMLHAGTMWLNADFDQDTGPVLFDGGPAELPASTRGIGVCALAIGTGVALTAGSTAGACAAACAALAGAYSSRTTALKAHPLGGPAVNGIGYGLLSPAAGWSLVEVSPTVRTAIASVVSIALILSLYFAAQAFQAHEDRERGYRTLVVTHGPRRTLEVSRCLLAIGSLIVLGMIIAQWLPVSCGLLLPGWLVCDRWLSHWRRARDGGTRSHAEAYVTRLLLFGTLTFGAALADYGVDRARGGPVAGLATRGLASEQPASLGSSTP